MDPVVVYLKSSCDKTNEIAQPADDMTTESILLVGRDAEALGELLETHAARLRERTDVASVQTATYEDEPIRELGPTLESLTADTVYAVPMVAAHTRDTTTEIPAALSAVPETVHYCEPVGQSPAITDVLAQRGADEVAPDGTPRSSS